MLTLINYYQSSRDVKLFWEETLSRYWPVYHFCWTLLDWGRFYEWKKDGKKKQPFYVHFKDEQPLVFAALYDSWEDAEGNFVLVPMFGSVVISFLHCLWAHCLTVCLQCVCRWGFVHIYHINDSCFQATWVASWWAYIFQQGTLDSCSGVSWIFLSLIDVLSIFWWVSSCLLNPCIIQSSICCWYVSAHMASMVFVAGMYLTCSFYRQGCTLILSYIGVKFVLNPGLICIMFLV